MKEEEEEKEFLPVFEEECPCCRMMKEEWGFVDEKPRRELQRRGVTVRKPSELTDDEVTVELWRIVEKLAEMRIFVESTDHLSDRQLYEKLVSEIEERMMYAPGDIYSATHIDLSGSCGDDLDNYLRYYADEETRKLFARDFPGDPIPPHEEPPFHRDELLPKPHDKWTEV